MKFGTAKLPKTFKKIPKKALRQNKKKQQQRIKLNRREENKYKSLLQWKRFVTWQVVILKLKIKPVCITAAANCNKHIL